MYRNHLEPRPVKELHIVAVRDFGEVPMRSKDSGDSEPLYSFVMEFVDGANLRQLMNGQRLDAQTPFAMPQDWT